jgi:hypothetical protein
MPQFVRMVEQYVSQESAGASEPASIEPPLLLPPLLLPPLLLPPLLLPPLSAAPLLLPPPVSAAASLPPPSPPPELLELQAKARKTPNDPVTAIVPKRYVVFMGVLIRPRRGFPVVLSFVPSWKKGVTDAKTRSGASGTRFSPRAELSRDRG